MDKPNVHVQQENVDKLQSYVSDSLDKLAQGRRVRDFEHHVFEHFIEAIYGPGFWDWYDSLEEGLTG